MFRRQSFAKTRSFVVWPPSHALFMPGEAHLNATNPCLCSHIINIINTNTSEVVFSSQGAGEYSLSEREIIGFGGTAGYDSTLNGKVLDLAIREAVNNLVAGIDTGAWRPTP